MLGLRQGIREAEAKNAADAAAGTGEQVQLGTPASNGTGAKEDEGVTARAAGQSKASDSQ